MGCGIEQPGVTAKRKRELMIALDLQKAWERRSVRWGVILGVWTVFGLVFASQSYLYSLRSAQPFRLQKSLLLELTYAYLWAALTPLLLWLARRYRFDRPHRVRNLLIHLIAGTVIGFAMKVIHDYMFTLIFLPPDRVVPLLRMLQNAYLVFDYGMMTYWVVLLLSNAFNYYQRYREGELRASQLETQLAQAQLQALKMQLHPHFLFNTLHSISALMQKDIDAADTMIARLGDFLRLTLDSESAQEVTLRREIEFLKCYMQIEQIRFQDRLTVRMDVEPEALEARVPNLILQPVVENAIKHGVAPCAGACLIEVTATKRKGRLLLQVRDNGPGIDLNDRSGVRRGIGLSNTEARLSKHYGSAYSLEMSSPDDGGLVVTVEIPFEIEPNGASGR